MIIKIIAQVYNFYFNSDFRGFSVILPQPTADIYRGYGLKLLQPEGLREGEAVLRILLTKDFDGVYVESEYGDISQYVWGPLGDIDSFWTPDNYLAETHLVLRKWTVQEESGVIAYASYVKFIVKEHAI